MDDIELIEKIENAFGVELSADELRGIETAGQLHELIWRKISNTPPERCATAHAFYKLRCAIAAHLKISNPPLRPSDRLDEIIPPEQRRDLWPKLSATLKAKLPRLTRPARVSRKVIAYTSAAIAVLYLTLALTAFANLTDGNSSLSNFQAAMIATLIALIPAAIIAVAVFATQRRATVPKNCATLGDIAKSLACDNYNVFALPISSQPEKIIWNQLAEIIAQQLGVSKNELEPGTRFAADLNLE